MALFDSPLTEILQTCERLDHAGQLTRLSDPAASDWPRGGNRNFVMKQDTAVELGGPRTESLAFTLWTEQPRTLTDRRISLIGPSLADGLGSTLPFGQIVLLELDGESGFDDDYQLFRNLEEIKYGIDLQGYMRRGASQFLREWSRISRDAMESGFDFNTLGRALMQRYRQRECIRSVEVLFITEPAVLREIKPLAVQVRRTISALHKMLNEAVTDCDDCEYNDICSEVAELRKLR